MLKCIQQSGQDALLLVIAGSQSAVSMIQVYIYISVSRIHSKGDYTTIILVEKSVGIIIVNVELKYNDVRMFSIEFVKKIEVPSGLY